MNKEVYKITLQGCDDYTEFIMNLSSEESDVIYRLSSLSKMYSTYCCQPVLKIEPTDNPPTLK